MQKSKYKNSNYVVNIFCKGNSTQTKLDLNVHNHPLLQKIVVLNTKKHVKNKRTIEIHLKIDCFDFTNLYKTYPQSGNEAINQNEPFVVQSKGNIKATGIYNNNQLNGFCNNSFFKKTK